MSWSEVQSLIVEKASRDEEFRQRLLADPLRVAEEEAGAKFPEGARIKVIEAEPETGYVVLPARLPARGELSEGMLNEVAGGAGVCTAFSLSVICSLTVSCG